MALKDKIKRWLGRKRRVIPDGLWLKCPRCQKVIFKKIVEEEKKVCPECKYYFPLSAAERQELMLDKDSFSELWPGLLPQDPLEFHISCSYKEKLREYQKITGLADAAVVGRGRICGRDVIFGCTDSRFMMGSMGSVVGEKVTRAFELAMAEKLPVIFVSGSGGGARMYEGCLSLMQMTKTSSAIARFSDAGGLYLSILTNPTMAGVMASFAALGDIVLAEPGALIGFTGPRVIQQTIKEKLPKGFQTSEFLLEHGFIDKIVERKALRSEVAKILSFLSPKTTAN